MSRKARIDAFGALHSITVRGFEGRHIFREGEDCDHFRDRMGEILTETGTACYAWALMPNHAHLLLRTGNTPIAMVMRRMLTGYAVTYNRRHHRRGPVFLDRYRSVLCEEAPYLLEMVRYIHLNPLRAGVVGDLGQLESYAYAGHGALLGGTIPAWQDVETVLKRFAGPHEQARKAYRRYVEEGESQGRRPELAGGGLVRSLGGWEQVKRRRGRGASARGDERILGGPEFVQRVLAEAEERLHPQAELALRGLDLNRLAERAAKAFGVPSEEIFSPGKVRKTVCARSVFCYWAVRKLGYTATDLAQRIGLSQPAVSISVQRGEALAREREIEILDREESFGNAV
ncbi:MAG: transposase [Desulfobacteraceae bacterium]